MTPCVVMWTFDEPPPPPPPSPVFMDPPLSYLEVQGSLTIVYFLGPFTFHKKGNYHFLYHCGDFHYASTKVDKIKTFSNLISPMYTLSMIFIFMRY